jgi:hypothetical protein
VARRPDQRTRKQTSTTSHPSLETPRYQRIPRWGLQDPPPGPADAADRPLGRLADLSSRLLIATAVLFVAACCAELGRYAVLLRNRTRLIPSWLLWLSDGLVFGAALVALALALVTAVAMLGWLIETRRVAYEKMGRRDPRSVRALALGCLIPVVNLVWPGVFLTETVALRPDPRALRAVRVWWLVWVLGAVCAVVALLYRAADSLQAKADGVMFTAFTDLVAAGVAVLTLWVMRAMAGRDLFGHTRIERRWVIAVDPAVPVIEPVQPGARAMEKADADSAVQDREQQEVMAK